MNQSSEFLQKLNFSNSEITACDFNANYLLAAALSNNTVRVLEWKTGLGFVDMFYSPISLHKYKITTVKFSPKGTMLVSASLDGTAILLDTLKGTQIFTMVQHNKSSIKFCQFTFDCTKILTASDDGVLCFWDLLHQRQLSNFRFHETDYNLKSLTFSPDSEYFISIDSTDLLKLWFVGDVLNHLPSCILRERNLHEDNSCCEFSPVKCITGDSSLKLKYNIVTSGGDGLIKVWDLTIEKGHRFETNTLRFECCLKLVNILKEHVSNVVTATYDPTGSFIVTTGLDNLVKLWEVSTGKCVKTFSEHTGLVNCAAFSKNSVLLATGSTDKNLIIWDLSLNLTLDSQLLISCKFLTHFAHIDLKNYVSENMETNTIQKSEFIFTQQLSFPSTINCVRFHNEDTLAIAGEDKNVSLWKKKKDTLLYENGSISKEYKYGINCLDVSSCGSKIIFCSIDGVITFWNLNLNSTYEMKTASCTSSLRICKFLPNSERVGAAGDDQEVYLWNANNLEFIRVAQKHENVITALAFTPDSEYLVSACSGGHIILQNLNGETCVGGIENAHDLGVTSCDFFPTEISKKCVKTHFTSKQKYNRIYMLATGGRDSLVKLWEIEGSKIFILKALYGHGDTVNDVKFSPCEPFFLASCSSDTTVRIWDTESKQCLQVLNFHKSAVTTCSFSCNSNVLATGSLDKTVLIFKLTNKIYWDCKEHISSKKLLENWTASELSSWFSEMGWRSVADKVLALELDGRALLTAPDNFLANQAELKSEDDRKALELQISRLKKASLSFSLNLHYKEDTIPHMFLCPITHEIMKEPVICSDGFVYEREALAEWFLSRKFISPVTKEYLKSTKFLSYSALKINIYKFLCESKK